MPLGDSAKRADHEVGEGRGGEGSGGVVGSALFGQVVVDDGGPGER